MARTIQAKTASVPVTSIHVEPPHDWTTLEQQYRLIRYELPDADAIQSRNLTVEAILTATASE